MQFCPHVSMLRKNYLTKHMFINDHTSPPDIALYIQTVSLTLTYLVFMCIRHFFAHQLFIIWFRKEIISNAFVYKERDKRLYNIFLCICQRKCQRRIQNPAEQLRWSFFAKIDKDFQPLPIFAKNSIADVPLGCKYVSVLITSSLPFENCSRINTHRKP